MSYNCSTKNLVVLDWFEITREFGGPGETRTRAPLVFKAPINTVKYTSLLRNSDKVSVVQNGTKTPVFACSVLPVFYEFAPGGAPPH